MGMTWMETRCGLESAVAAKSWGASVGHRAALVTSKLDWTVHHGMNTKIGTLCAAERRNNAYTGLFLRSRESC